MITLVTNKKDAIIEHFLINPTKEFHLRELERLLGISFPWIRKRVIELTKNNFLIKKEERGLVLVKANREEEQFIGLKRSYNLHTVYESGLLKKLIETYQRPEAIILFGSYSKGEDTEESDIDVAIITKRKEKKEYSDYEKKLKRKINIIEVPKEKVEKEFKKTVMNGIVLHGYLDV